jgi:glycosyltransferase involved in cell wall biosynthesis
VVSRVACVVIGRNEGERLRRCLESVLAECANIVYVDSASTDGSASLAERLGVETIRLTEAEPLSAARGRNAGFFHATATTPSLEYVQFVDGDSELAPGWLAAGMMELDRIPAAAAACGRIREKHPGRSIYNSLYEMEWVHAPGDIEWWGGTAMFRVSAFRNVGGFDPTLIAGEDSDLYARLRARGHRVRSIAHDMAIHDADITRFSAWWMRNVRTGHAYAEAKSRHPDSPAMRSGKAVRSIAFWGFWLPCLSLSLAAPTLGVSLLASAGGYPALLVRVYRTMRERGFSRASARLYATFCVLGKFPQAFGMLRHRVLERRGRRSALIEYKGPA